MIIRTAALTVIFIFGICTVSPAYVGPGAGLSLLGALWGLLVAVGAALVFVIFWPVRRLWRQAKSKKKAESEEIK